VVAVVPIKTLRSVSRAALVEVEALLRLTRSTQGEQRLKVLQVLVLLVVRDEAGQDTSVVVEVELAELAYKQLATLEQVPAELEELAQLLAQTLSMLVVEAVQLTTTRTEHKMVLQA
jgi:inorganic pyrophosphatase